MSVAPLTVGWSEDAESPQETGTIDRFSARRVLYIPWANRDDLLAEVLQPPGQLYPYAVANECRARSVTITPFGAQRDAQGGGGFDYEQAIATIEYSTPGDDDEIQPGGGGTALVSETLEPTAEFITLPSTLFRWGSADGVPLEPEEAPGRLMLGAEYIFKVHHLPSIPPAALSLVGRVNVNLVVSLSLGLTFAAETLLMRPSLIERTQFISGVQSFTITYRLAYRPTGWNKFWRPDSQGFVEIYLASGGVYKNYPTGDFTQL